MKLSAVLMASHGLTKGSLAFLNYPAQLMFKSTKVYIFIYYNSRIEFQLALLLVLLYICMCLSCCLDGWWSITSGDAMMFLYLVE